MKEQAEKGSSDWGREEPSGHFMAVSKGSLYYGVVLGSPLPMSLGRGKGLQKHPFIHPGAQGGVVVCTTRS